MDEITDVAPLRAWAAERRAAGERIALVPTMGYLHEGHLALVDAARREADRVVLSSFVNPLQFGLGEDLARYPHDDERDRKLARGRGVDLLYRPTVEAMYPPGSEIRVVPGDAGARWEGTFRPGHFEGVLTVVAKLFHQVTPDVACFGQKDIQQATLVRQMVRDLDWKLDIVVVPTVREPDGLALSSRNVYLSPDQRRDARGLSQALAEAHDAWREGERSAAAIVARMRARLEVFGGLEIEYIGVLEQTTFQSIATVTAASVVAIAGRLGDTRLIDNIILGKGLT